ncbi:hypothetical protein Micbo1qcDRAFT_167162 [Microdochium bolleyi]|uniref:Thioredoxin-like fold domain-containing protein n=1 Tax=Microdochium bolleyi TaxID=196109 RepID=A0A136IS58_9PEZI|nr:hypothetical protein Micbo1qcDRAFT_167162 [Microdochium bolleyi]
MASAAVPDGSARQEQQQSSRSQTPSSARPRHATTTTSTAVPETSSGWFAIPAPLARLFKRFPLLTYPPNELPARSPQQQRDVATLYVFISDADALKGLPSYNPTCLKWQTFLRLAGAANVRIASSNNHASPTGALPFLIAPGGSSSSSSNSSSSSLAATSSPTILPSNKLEQYALSHARSSNSNSNKNDKKSKHTHLVSDIPASQAHRFEAYTALLDHKIRNAWLYALYLCPRNTDLLRHWYIRPASNSAAVQTATLYQLRAAAEAEITRSSPHNTLRAIYHGASATLAGGSAERKGHKLFEDAREAFSAMATCLDENQGGADGWFFGAEAPGVFDAAVFAYTYLILLDKDGDGGGDGGPGWGDGTLAEIVREFPSLVRHRDRVYRRCWGSG